MFQCPSHEAEVIVTQEPAGGGPCANNEDEQLPHVPAAGHRADGHAADRGR